MTAESEAMQGEVTYTYKCDKADCWYCEIVSEKPPREYPIITTSHMETVRKNWDSLSLTDIGEIISMSKSYCSKLGSYMGLPRKNRIRVKVKQVHRTPRKAALSTSWW